MTERRKRPHSTSVLERWAQKFAREHGLAKKRVQDWISYMILASQLERASRAGEGGRFTIKGGVALEMRLGGEARATRDLDLIVQVDDTEDPVSALRTALQDPYQDFTFRVKDDLYEMEDGSVRVAVALEYKERGWGTVRVDLSPEEGHRLEREEVPPLDLSFFGLEPAVGLSCLSVPYHLAHKIHGMTRPSTEDYPNERVNDLVDLFLLQDLTDDRNRVELRDACLEVFEVRDGHRWPPDLNPPDFWRAEFEATATRLGLEITQFHAALNAARRYIAEIDSAA